jgi:hypothetical protein
MGTGIGRKSDDGSGEVAMELAALFSRACALRKKSQEMIRWARRRAGVGEDAIPRGNQTIFH